MRVPKAILIRLATAALICMGALASLNVSAEDTDPPPAPLREFRGLWVATVNNIDWPSRRGLSPQEQQAELRAIFDRAARLRFNAVIFQVRPSSDALYESKIEPWSEYLTGRMGEPPSPFYDPLALAVAEAHKRGLELHAWFNPFRARSADAKTPISPAHVVRAHPEWVRSCGKTLWLDPGLSAVRQHSLNVIMDVVRRYDIDAVHFDDYFYPYPEKVNGQDTDFPDESSWRAYRGRDGKLSRADWRRQNIDSFVHEVYEAIKLAKPWVKFGISPFGIWRPHFPPQITGFDPYESLYADSRKWLANGWVDYLAPQLYWPIAQKAQSFGALLQWWAEQNPRQRNLWPGMRLNDWSGGLAAPDEPIREIELIRRQPGASGEILWHAATLIREEGLAESLTKRVYTGAALVPASPWLSSGTSPKPVITATTVSGRLQIEWSCASDAVRLWLVREKTDGHWRTEILPGEESSLRFKPGETAPRIFTVCAVDRFGELSPLAELEESHSAEGHR